MHGRPHLQVCVKPAGPVDLFPMVDKKKGLSPDSFEGLMVVLQAIEDTIQEGHIPEGLVISADEEVRKKLEVILTDIITTQQFTLALAQGDLSQDLTVKGSTAGSLKALQSSLRHLTWQAGQIESGDLSQRVHFMGEFSDSFNTMVEHLSEEKINRTHREDDLRRVNAALAYEVAEHRKTEDALRQANRKITMLSSITRHDIKNQLLALRGFLGLSQSITSGVPAAGSKVSGVLQGLGGLLGGGVPSTENPPPNAATNQPASKQELIGNLLNNLLKPRK